MKVSNRPILIVGYGSIGRRHFRNLKKLGFKNFVFYRTGKSTLPTDEISDVPVERTLARALSYKPVATIIANPTSLHIPVALAAARVGSHIFLEKPISHSIRDVEQLHKLAKRKKLIVQVGFQFRFHPEIQRLKKQLESKKMGPVLSIQAHWGEYLPNWHPWEDYHKSYSARKEMGGGVLLTLCHPFDYLRFLFGEVESVAATTSKQGNLNIDVETCADVLLQFRSGVTGTVHLDYLQRPTEHFLRIITEKGTHYLDFTSKQFDRNKMFLDEISHFMRCIKYNGKPLCTLEDGMKTLHLILGAKKSAQDKKRVV